jgi:hypothetical protein
MNSTTINAAMAAMTRNQRVISQTRRPREPPHDAGLGRLGFVGGRWKRVEIHYVCW